MQRIRDTKDLGKLIRESRKRQGLTQEQLAATCGVGMRYLRELEHGKESCYIGKALLLVQMLGISILMNEESI